MIVDIRYALRRARRAPGFFACAALLIALGTAVNMTIFTLVNALLLRPLAVREPGNLVQLIEVRPKLPPNPYYVYGFWKQLTQVSSTLAGAVGQMEFATSLERDAGAERAHLECVTENYFAEFGVTPSMGRVLTAGDNRTAVLSYAYWSRSLGRDPGAIGRTVRIHGQPFVIVGVAAQEFNGTTIDSGPDLWIPIANLPDIQNSRSPTRDTLPVEIVARLRTGFRMAQAEAETQLLWTRYLKDRSMNEQGGLAAPHLEIRSIAQGLSPIRDQSRTGLVVLLSGSALLLLMVCANVGGLLLARSTAREKEAAVRLAIGASRMRIAFQNLTEALLLAVSGGAAGWLIAAGSMPFLWRLLPPARGIGFDPQEIRSLTLDLRPDMRVAFFSIAACGLTAVLCALAPAWRSSQTDISAALKSTMSDVRHRRFQAMLCGVQVALCTLLLFCAGLMGRTLANLRNSGGGFEVKHIAIFTLDSHFRGFDSKAAWIFRRRLLDGVKRLPGVENAAIASRALMRGTGLVNSVVMPGQRGDGVVNSSMNSVTPEFFDVMGIRLRAGRGFRENDVEEEGKPATVIVNQAFADKFLAGRSALGARFGTGKGAVAPRFEVIGVVDNIKYRSLREIPPPMFFTYNFGPEAYPESFVLHVRTRSDPAEMLQPVRELVKSIDPMVPVYQSATLAEEVDRSLWQERFLTALASSFGVFAMGLSTIGLYAILAYFVVRRRREIGLRIALGAQVPQVAWCVAGRVLPILGAGLAAGAVLSISAGAWLGSLLYGIRPLDASSAAIATVLVALSGIGAAVAPAVRAIRVDPAATLRQE